MRVIATIVALLFCGGPTWAYGQEGHEAICQIAYKELTDKARAEVDRLIALEPEADERLFRVGCRWPDRYNEFPADLKPRSSDHYINVPRGTTAITGDCFDKRGNIAQRCLLRAIEHETRILSDTTADDVSKLKALKFLGHWLGDIHQPLHVSYADDRGGNDVLADATGCNDKLHAVWDTCIPRDQMMERGYRLKQDRGAFGDSLWSEITDAERTSWLNSGAVDWANESYKIAQQADLGYCIMDNGVCAYSETELTYDGGTKRTVMTQDAYEDQFGPMVRERMKQAGVRLGALLNKIHGR
ncbi:S1/P1 nuclease [Kordiimonas sp.]|uniref:S1/P1 nuclease n=1 Tax=Kordiimonas sp. TaxID=1970157 RepID=UPI003A8E3A81